MPQEQNPGRRRPCPIQTRSALQPLLLPERHAGQARATGPL